MSLKEYVNRFYQEKINEKDYSAGERLSYIWLSTLYIGTLKGFTLIGEPGDTVELIRDDHRVKIVLFVAGQSVLIYRDNKTELIEDIGGFITALFWMKF